MKNIQVKLFEIEELLKNESCNNFGLFNGNCGSIIFFSSLYLTDKKNEIKAIIEIKLQNVLSQIEKEGSNHTFANGYSGLGWTINNLKKNGLIDVNIERLFEDIEGYLIKSSENDLKNNFYDFMHGGLGAGIYFLDRLDNDNAVNFLYNIIEYLYNQAEVVDNKVKWPCYFNRNINDKHPEYNLGISHGIPSIIWFLSKSYEMGINKDKCKLLVQNSINWLLNQQLTENYISKFPSSIDGSKHKIHSRLGWCYGDLGISVVLLQAAKIFNENNWREESIKIMLHSSKRKDLTENAIMDAGICHGTSGIAHVFNKFYFETKIPEFKEAANYWIEETLKMATFEDGLAGFKTYRAEYGWHKNSGLLEGVSGIGLALHSYLHPEIEPTWDRCLLLS